MNTSSIVLESFVVGPFQENCHFIRRADRPETVIIDPGDEAAKLLHHLERQSLRPVAILNTHAHLDHIGAVEPLQQRFGIPFHLHPADLPTLQSAPESARMFGVPVPAVPQVDAELAHGQIVDAAGLAFAVRHTPGHTPGHVCFLVEDVVFSGDLLFMGSVGRTDLPGGNTVLLFASIEKELLTLDDATRVLSGHGPATTIGRERRHNPFLQKSAGFISTQD